MKLDPVQIAALKAANGAPGFAYFLQMGLGKSLLALAEFQALGREKQVSRLVIVCPNSFKGGWLDEIDKHGFQFDVHVYQSSTKRANEAFLAKRYELPPVLIVNYEAARLPAITMQIGAWIKQKATMLVLDESIALKGHASAQTKAALTLAKQADFVRLLSGKPQSQGPHDLWAQLQAIGLFPERNFYAFRGMFCQMGGWEMKQVVGAQNADILAKAMAPKVFQALKKDWLPDLPEKRYTIRDYEMDEDQRKQYKQMEMEFLLEIEQGVITVDVAVAKYEKLSQIMSGFILDETGRTHDLVEIGKNPRLNLIREILADEINDKAIIVYRHKHALNLLLRALPAYEPAVIKGGMTPEQLADEKTRFLEDPHCRVILVQEQAGKFGHTLHVDGACSTMVFFENSYSLDDRSQVEDRIHRRGQTASECLYVDLVGSALDRRVIRALQRKENLYTAVFSRLRKAEPV